MLVVRFTWYQTGEATNQAETFHNLYPILYVNHGSGQIEVRGIASKMYLRSSKQSVS